MATKLTAEKKEIIGNLIEAYDIKTTKDIQEALKDLLGGTIQEMLESELEEQIGHERYESTEEEKTNYRNGHKTKQLKTSMGSMEIEVPQDRNSEFEPKIVPKYKRDVSEIEEKIINMYARGQSTREIRVTNVNVVHMQFTPIDVSRSRTYTGSRQARSW